VNWWGFPAWGALAAWMPFGWGQPVYYNYGDNVYYQGDSVYYGDQAYTTTQEYAQQASQIAASAPPEADQKNAQFMPLGVFALTRDGEASGPEPTMYLQLAVSKEGALVGTYQNTVVDQAQTLEGMVDKKTQRAAWTVTGKKWPVMETGIYNLTKDTAPVLIHFESGDTQQWLLVRMDKPKDDGAAKEGAAAESAPPPPAGN
jgi:hypothetical protein